MTKNYFVLALISCSFDLPIPSCCTSDNCTIQEQLYFMQLHNINDAELEKDVKLGNVNRIRIECGGVSVDYKELPKSE